MITTATAFDRGRLARRAPGVAQLRSADGKSATPTGSGLVSAHYDLRSVLGGPPHVAVPTIRRPRLERLLDAGPVPGVTVVRGPAGIGKTVLVSQWLAADDRRFAWVTLDRADDEPGHLVRRLVDAFVGACRTVALGDAGAVGDDRGFDANLLLDRLVAAPEMLDPDVVLVLDDVDRVRGPAGRAVLAALVEHAHTRLVLVCRYRPAIGLERARLRGAVHEVPASALRFERGEVKELTERRGAHAGAEIEQATRGWAAGLRLLELGGATGDHRALAAATADDPNARAYVREEVLADLSQELAELLYTTSWLPIFTLDVCRALAPDLPGAAQLGEAAIEAVPLTPIASRPGAFRYPPLLAEILRRESAARDGDAGASRRHRAASAAQDAGELDIAIELYLDGGWYDQAADACIALMRRDPNALRAAHGWFGTIPPETLLGDGARIAARVRAALAVGDIATARSWANRAAARTGSRGGELRTPELLHARAAVAQRCGDFETLLECAAATLTHSPDPTTAAPAHAARVRALVWQGRLEAARAALSRFADVAPALPRSTTDLATARAWVAWLEGDASQAWKSAGGIIVEDTADEAQYAELVLLAGAAQREQNRLADAVRLLETAATLAKRTSHSVVAVLAACELAAVRAANGAILPALESIIATGDAHPGLPPAVVDQLRTAEARLRLRNGDIEGVAILLCDATETVDTRLLQARLAVARGSLDVPGLLAGLEPVTPRQEVQCRLIRAAYHAKAAEGTGSSKRRDVADDDVLAAVSRGGPLGLVRTFLDEDPALLASLRRLAATHGDIALGRLAALAAEDAAAPPLADAARPLTTLTKRELGVLRLLPTRLSNREMATELYVSVNTLKSHVRSIYRKLGVAGRSEAIRRARALHLV